jgi:hypothetical protein
VLFVGDTLIDARGGSGRKASKSDCSGPSAAETCCSASSALCSSAATPSGTVAAILFAVVVVAAARLALGASAGRPGTAEVADVLIAKGMPSLTS